MKIENVIVGFFIQYNGTDENGDYCGMGMVVDKDNDNKFAYVEAPGKIVAVPEDCIVAMGPKIESVLNVDAVNEFLETHEPDDISHITH